MKKFSLLFLFLMGLNTAQALDPVDDPDRNPWLFGVKFLYNINSIDTAASMERIWEAKNTVGYGLKGVNRINERHGINVEILYDTRKLEAKNLAAGPLSADYRYASFGMAYQYTLAKFPLLLIAGANLSFCIDTNMEGSRAAIASVDEITKANTPLLAGVGGLGYQFRVARWLMLQPELTYHYSMTHANDVGTNFRMHTIQLGLSAMY